MSFDAEGAVDQAHRQRPRDVFLDGGLRDLTDVEPSLQGSLDVIGVSERGVLDLSFLLSERRTTNPVPRRLRAESDDFIRQWSCSRIVSARRESTGDVGRGSRPERAQSSTKLTVLHEGRAETVVR